MTKYIIISAIAFFTLGYICGHKTNANSVTSVNSRAETNTVKYIEMGHTLPDWFALTASKDMRLLKLLKGNDTNWVERIIIQDLDIQISNLNALTNDFTLSQFNSNILVEGKTYLISDTTNLHQ